MNRLLVRLIVSHVLVAVLGGLTTFLIVRQVAPSLFDHSLTGSGMGPGMGRLQMGTLRAQFGDAVDTALLAGTLVGAAAAGLFGALAASRLVRPLDSVRAATRELAAGRYHTRVPIPREHELAELSADVNLLGQTLAETETRRVQLLGEVAHEMRTPLTVIDGYVEGMIDGVVAPGPEELDRVGEEVRRLRRLTDDLSALSRSDEGRLELKPEARDLREVVVGAAERLRAQAEDASLTLQVDPGPAPLPVVVDADRIAQVITNLVGNALRATPAGGTVTVACARSGTEAVAQVTDSGEGLAAAELERVFERFYRVPGRRGGRDSGSGIGLTIARGIVAAHGGVLAAASLGAGRGASLTMRLPLARVEA
jgi:histidine kinase